MENFKINMVGVKDDNGIYYIDDVKKAYHENKKRVHCYKILKDLIKAYNENAIDSYISKCSYDELCEVWDIMAFMKYDYYEVIGKVVSKIHEYEGDIFIDMIKNIDENNFMNWLESLSMQELRMLKKALFTFNFGNDNKDDKYILMEEKINIYYEKLKGGR